MDQIHEIELEDCPVCRGIGTLEDEAGWCIYAVCLDCGAQTAHVGYNTPAIIKYSFWRMTAKNPKAIYACINLGEPVTMRGLEKQSILIDGDIGAVIHALHQP